MMPSRPIQKWKLASLSEYSFAFQSRGISQYSIPKGQESVPAEGADMHVGDCPVGEMRERIHALDRKRRSFEGRHPVGRHGHHHELQHGIFTHFVPGAAQGQQTVEHAAP